MPSRFSVASERQPILTIPDVSVSDAFDPVNSAPLPSILTRPALDTAAVPMKACHTFSVMPVAVTLAPFDMLIWVAVDLKTMRDIGGVPVLLFKPNTEWNTVVDPVRLVNAACV